MRYAQCPDCGYSCRLDPRFGVTGQCPRCKARGRTVALLTSGQVRRTASTTPNYQTDSPRTPGTRPRKPGGGPSPGKEGTRTP